MTPKVYKASEVCEIAGLQPYVLRSWEKEFPRIGVQKSPESPRLYRQSDLDQVLRIKQLVFGEGLTLSGARRRLEESVSGVPGPHTAAAEVFDVLRADARARIAPVRSGLHSILDVLSKAPGSAVASGATAAARALSPRSKMPIAQRAATGRSANADRSPGGGSSGRAATRSRDVLARNGARRKRASA